MPWLLLKCVAAFSCTEKMISKNRFSYQFLVRVHYTFTNVKSFEKFGLENARKNVVHYLYVCLCVLANFNKLQKPEILTDFYIQRAL